MKTIYTRIGSEEEVLFPLLDETGAELPKSERNDGLPPAGREQG